MKLMGLLSVGRSVVRTNDKTHYNLMSVKSLRGTELERLEPPLTSRAETETVIRSAPDLATLASAGGVPGGSLESGRLIAAVDPAVARQGFLARWLRRLDPLRWDWANLLTGRSRRRGFEGPVQRELFVLQHVKPMRNDLSDSDVESVPSRKSRSAGRFIEAPALDRTGPVWRRISKRFAGTAKS